MSKLGRSVALVAAASLAVSGLSLSASADEVRVEAQTTATDVRPHTSSIDGVSRGLIVQTTSTTPSDGLLEATDAALDGETDVAGDEQLTGSISTVEFTDEISSDAAADAAAQIEKRADVVWAVPDTLRQATAKAVTPKDPLYRQQWGLSSRYGIKSPSLWPATRGKGVRVAVIDTGVAPHRELTGQTVRGYDMIGPDHHGGRKTYVNAGDDTGRDSNPTDPGDWASANRCYDGSPAWDSSWHGTFIAGQIAAKADNNTGIAGAAPGVKIQPVRVLGRCGGWDSDILAGITWASGGHVRGVPDNKLPSQVLNLSLGGSYETRRATVKACKPFETAARAARKRGAVLIASAGNEGDDADHVVPGSCAGYVSVGAVSRKGYRAEYSNKGSSVDISAPGGDSFISGSGDRIVSLGNTGRRSAAHSSYARYEGTSMAAAYVSAGAALMYAVGLDTAAEVEKGLMTSVTAFPRAPRAYRKRYHGTTYVFDLRCKRATCGAGVLNLTKVQAPAGPLTLTGVQAGHAVVGKRLTVRESRVGPAVTYRWFREPLSSGGRRVAISSAKSYVPRSSDVGHRLLVVSKPGGPWFSLGTRTSTTVTASTGG